MTQTYTLMTSSVCGLLALAAVACRQSAPQESMARPAQSAAYSEGNSRAPAAVHNPAGDPTGEQIAVLRGEVTRLDAKVEALRREVEGRLTAHLAAGSGGEEDEPAPGDPRALAEAQRQERERAQTLETHFRTASTTDQGWIAHASAAVAEAFASGRAANTQVTNLECRSGQCRVEVRIQDGAARDHVMSWLPQQLAETMPIIAVSQVEQLDGGTAMVLYLFGEGHEPPSQGG
jgi:hypothetical protein